MKKEDTLIKTFEEFGWNVERDDKCYYGTSYVWGVK